MVSDKWLASCHRRTIHTMKIKAITMSEQWEGRNAQVSNELTTLIHYLDNAEDFLYFAMKGKNTEREKSE